MPGSKAGAVRVKSIERRQKALDLRRSGATYRQIGTALGISEQAARKHVEAELKRLEAACHETAEEVRHLELIRLDSLTLGIWERATAGDPKAVEAFLKIQERRGRMLGIDGPPPENGSSILLDTFGELLRKVYAEPPKVDHDPDGSAG